LSESSIGIDETYYPPFPWCLANIYDLPKTKNVIAKGYTDTGSDVTIATMDIDERLELHRQPVTLAEIMGIGGKPEVRALYAAVFIVKGIEVVTAVDIRDDVEEVLIGRDILHHLSLSIDWKKGTIDLKDPMIRGQRNTKVKLKGK